MHFRQKLHEAYEAGYRSGLNEQSGVGSPTSPYRLPEFTNWNQILLQMETMLYSPPDQQGPYGQMYDYNGDGAVDQFDLQFAQAMAELYPNRVFTAFNQPQGLYQEWFTSTFARPMPDRRIQRPNDMRLSRRKANFASKRKGKKPQRAGTPPYFPGGGGGGGPYPPGGGRPAAPGGQGT